MRNLPIISQRGVRIVGCALLFCAFAYGYFTFLIGEQLSAFTAKWGLIAPFWWGAIASLLTLPLSLYWLSRYAMRYSTLSLLLRTALVFFLLGWITPSDELATLELRTARLAAQGQWEKALTIGSKSQQGSPMLTSLRSEILQRQGANALPLYFFDYPIPLEADSSWLAPSSHPYRHLLPSLPPSPHVELLGLLLNRQLESFAQKLQAYRLLSDSLPPVYLQALLLHKRLSPHPVVNFTHSTTEANYRDFVDYRHRVKSLPLLQRHPSLRAEANLLYPLYGNTYWWYYFYNRSLPN